MQRKNHLLHLADESRHQKDWKSNDHQDQGKLELLLHQDSGQEAHEGPEKRRAAKHKHQKPFQSLRGVFVEVHEVVIEKQVRDHVEDEDDQEGYEIRYQPKRFVVESLVDVFLKDIFQLQQNCSANEEGVEGGFLSEKVVEGRSVHVGLDGTMVVAVQVHEVQVNYDGYHHGQDEPQVEIELVLELEYERVIEEEEELINEASLFVVLGT